MGVVPIVIVVTSCSLVAFTGFVPVIVICGVVAMLFGCRYFVVVPCAVVVIVVGVVIECVVVIIVVACVVALVVAVVFVVLLLLSFLTR